jgi:hypothetical protein
MQIWLHYDQDLDNNWKFDSLTSTNNHGASGGNMTFCD